MIRGSERRGSWIVIRGSEIMSIVGRDHIRGNLRSYTEKDERSVYARITDHEGRITITPWIMIRDSGIEDGDGFDPILLFGVEFLRT